MLLPGQYGPGVDVWSAGCVLYDLVSAVNQSAPVLRSEPLFNGTSDPNLSPRGYAHATRRNQLSEILATCGTKTKCVFTDVAHLGSGAALGSVSSEDGTGGG